MYRVATMTIIRGAGECQAYMDGVVNAEMQRQNAIRKQEMAAVRAELETAQAHRDRLLMEKLGEVKSMLTNRKPCILRRVIDELQAGWALVWYMGERLGLWEYVGKDE